MLQGIETVQSNLTATDNKIVGISDYIVESYRNGTEWYKKYKSGWVEQGGYYETIQMGTIVTLPTAFANSNYVIVGSIDSVYYKPSFSEKKTTSFKPDCGIAGVGYNGSTTNLNWYACGQGA